MTEVTLKFGFEFEGAMEGKAGQVKLGMEEGMLRPYELLAGALGSCLFATFQEIVEKMRLSFRECDMEVRIEKRETVPTTAKNVYVKAIICGGDPTKKDKYERAYLLATEHCSIYQTLSHVAEMKYELEICND